MIKGFATTVERPADAAGGVAAIDHGVGAQAEHGFQGGVGHFPGPITRLGHADNGGVDDIGDIQVLDTQRAAGGKRGIGLGEGISVGVSAPSDPGLGGRLAGSLDWLASLIFVPGPNQALR